MFCPYCGNKNPDDARFCMGCGKSIGEGKKSGKFDKEDLGISSQPLSYEELRKQGKIKIPPEYPLSFNPLSFCWPAFWFGIWWYLVKGMWKKALAITLILIGVGIVTYGYGAIPVGFGFWIYFGIVGYRDYLRYYSTDRQFWF